MCCNETLYAFHPFLCPFFFFFVVAVFVFLMLVVVLLFCVYICARPRVARASAWRKIHTSDKALWNGVCVNWSEISVHRTASLSHSKFYCTCGKTNLMLDLLVDKWEVDKAKNIYNNSNNNGNHDYHHLWTCIFVYVCRNVYLYILVSFIHPCPHLYLRNCMRVTATTDTIKIKY